MRILLDESLPRTLRAELLEHSVKTVAGMGWSSIKNGELLRRAPDQFDVFLTADQNLSYQQNLSTLPVSVVVLAARTNRNEALRPLVPQLLVSLASLRPQSFVRVEG
jgi:predicted nuclease of predicted toxin-antitoxin system